MTRREKILETRRLRRLGLTAVEIGRRLGVSASTVRNWYLGGECEVCGAPLNGSDGKKSTRCTEHPVVTWTRQAIIEAMQRWAAEHGRPPTTSDWLNAGADGSHPQFSSVYRSSAHPRAAFGSWAEALEAAGFPRPRQGQHGTWRDRASIIAAVCQWVEDHGEPPRQGDWVIVGPHNPSHRTVSYYFGSWNAAIAAAGFATRKQGGRIRDRVAA